jgi:exonuclease III
MITPFVPLRTTLQVFPILPLSQNCNSLNISTECDKQLSKIIAITSLCTSVIFLSDLRLCGTPEQCNKISKLFLTNSNKQYQFYYNSTKNSRGVGILIDNSLQIVVKYVFKDPQENILGLTVLLDDTTINIISIYGPNSNDKNFFNHLSECISHTPNTPTIIGGDWNTTYCTNSTKSNRDILNMVLPPSPLRSGWLNDLCRAHNLLDPYRAFYPIARDFTFTPRGEKKNRLWIIMRVFYE